MGELVERWNRYWFRPAPLINLAICRILIVGVQLSVLIGSDYHNYNRLYELSGLPDILYDPLPVLRVFLWPFGWMYRPPFEVLVATYGISLAAGVLALVGFKTRFSLSAFAVANLFLQSFSYSFHEYHHPEALMMIALSLLAIGPAGAVLSADDLWRRVRANSSRRRFAASANILGETSAFARWPLLQVQWLLALVYLAAATSKLGAAGFDWMNGYTLQYYILRDGLRWSDVGVWVAHQSSLVWWSSWITILFEGTFFAVLIFPVLSWLYIPLGLAFHTGIYLTMGAFFFQFIVIYSVFIPWAHMLEALSRRIVWLRPGKQLEVFFDGQCPLCIRSMTILSYFDWFDSIVLTDLETGWSRLAPSHPKISLEDCRREMHLLLPGGSVQKGFFAFREILWRLPPLWPLLVLFYLPLAATIGPSLYRWIASLRSRLQPRMLETCSAHCGVKLSGNGYRR
ncbi:MAG: thiol-disulfide oxidoreductase DCC family protein [Candidatus Binatia bacterium]